MTNKKRFGPKNAEEAAIYAEEKLIADVQLVIELVMHEKNISQAKLAEMMNIAPSTISKMLNGSNNLRLNSIARIFHFLQDTPAFTSAVYEKLAEVGKAKRFVETKNTGSSSHAVIINRSFIRGLHPNAALTRTPAEQCTFRLNADVKKWKVNTIDVQVLYADCSDDVNVDEYHDSGNAHLDMNLDKYLVKTKHA